MSSPRSHSRLGRPLRRVRRWARHTPNGEIALTLISVGVMFVIAAVIVAVLL